MKKWKLTILFFAIVILSFSCKKEEEENTINSNPVVKVYDSYLYANDISNIVPANTSTEDSISIVQSYINNWIQNQLMLNKAESYLEDQKKEIDKKTKEFRNSLMIHKFKETLITTNIDSNIANEKITNYYEAHKQEFKLSSAIVKGYFLKLPKESESFAEFKILFGNTGQVNLDELISFVNLNEGSFENFTTKWVIFSEKMLKMPIVVNDENDFLKRSSTFEAEDDQFYYYMHIIDYMKSREIAPVEHVKNNIANILIQLESSSIIEKYKQDIYDEALKTGDIEYF